MKKKIEHCFNQGAATYEHAAVLQKKVANHLASRLVTYSPATVLEIGCGTGLLSRQLIRLFPRAQIALTDIASNMVEQCQPLTAMHPHVSAFYLDGENPSLSSRFDLIVSSMTLHWFSHIQTSFKQLMNCLAPQGDFVFAMLGENSLQEWRAICETYGIKSATPSFPTYQTLISSFPDFQLEREIIMHPYTSAYDFLKQLKQLGAHASPISHIPLSAGKLRKILRHFSKPLSITYDVIYGHYQKK